MVLKQAAIPAGGANAQSDLNAAAPSPVPAPMGGEEVNTQSPESSMTEEAVSI
jgi:hypothetical protein